MRSAPRPRSVISTLRARCHFYLAPTRLCETASSSSPPTETEPRQERCGRVRFEGGPADAIPCDPQSSFRVIDLGLCTLQAVLRLVEPGSRCVAVRQPLTLSFEVAARVGQWALRGGESRLRRAQLIELVLRVGFGQHLSRLDPSADVDRSFDHPPGDAKGTDDGYSAWQVEAAVAKMPVLRRDCQTVGRHERFRRLAPAMGG